MPAEIFEAYRHASESRDPFGKLTDVEEPPLEELILDFDSMLMELRYGRELFLLNQYLYPPTVKE